MSASVDLSFVIPLRDEAPTLRDLITRIYAVCAGIGKSAEIIAVNDGSRDTSQAVLEDLAATHPTLTVITFRRSFGKAAALMAGFQATRGPIVFTLDADLQDDPDEIPNFLKVLDDTGADLLSGWKFPRLDSTLKNASSSVYNFFLRWFSGLKLHDMNCGFKCYRRAVIEDLRLYGDLHRFIPVLAAARGFKVGEIKVKHHKRQHGRSHYNWKRYFSSATDLIAVLWLTRWSQKPWQPLGYLGTALIVFALAVFIAAQHAPVEPRLQLWFAPCLILGGCAWFAALLAALIVHHLPHGLEPPAIAKTIGQTRDPA